jgi:hypothetical protein
MQLALRPWITAGVVTAGTSIIAATPVTGPRPDVQLPAVQLSAASTDLFGTVGNTVGARLNPIGGGRNFY